MSNWQELNAGWFSCEVQEIIENLQHAMFNSHPCGNSQLQNLINAGKWGKTCDQQMELSRTHQHLLNLSNFQVSHPNVTFSIHLLRKPCSQEKSNKLLQNNCLFLENIYEYNNGKKVGGYIYFLSKTMNKRWKRVLETSLNDKIRNYL